MRKTTILRDISIFIAIFLIFFLMMYFNVFSNVSSVITDRLYGDKEILDNIVMVEIDDESINKIGRWPWDRDVYARMLDNINNARVIGMDLSFFEESEDDESLRRKLSSMNNVVLAAEINNNQLFTPIFDTDFGYVNFRAESDGVIRKVNPNLREGISHFAFEIYIKYWNPDFKLLNKDYLINFANVNSFESVKAHEVFNKEIDFGNKFVLVGATAPNLHDNYFVPTSGGVAMSGIEIHANILQNLILDNFLEKQGVLFKLIFVFLIGLAGIFSLSKLKIYYLVPIILAIIVFYFLIGIFIFSKFNYIIDLFFFPIATLIFTGTGVGINYLERKKENAYLTDAFGRYIDKSLLKEIVEHKNELKLGGDKREITIFFSDIRNFTSISEKLKPDELVNLLNEYLTEMTRIILEHKGTVDKFIGDAIMAFWNAPLIEKDHAQLACRSAIMQIETLRRLKSKWKSENLPEVNIGCGLHTGEAIIGNMGSEDRFDYTAMGDNINLGSRLEGLTKQYAVEIIVSENTYKVVKDKFKFRKLDIVKVKGKKIPVVIYELIVDYNGEFVKQYEKALGLYLMLDFKKALKEFEDALKIKKDDESCKLFTKRCKDYIENPPGKDWDGAFEFKTK